ncbi:MAG: TIM barrel protein, partial [Verrucomicrobiales bacterium]|nr:TIM barrel protein [Verrucomicrobiales bacterium]
MGISDEAAQSLEGQITAFKRLGWRHIEMREVEVPGFTKANFHDLDDRAFEQVVARLDQSGIEVYCLASAILNWAKTIHTPFSVTSAEVRRAINRMHRTGAKYVRIMSFKPGDDEFRIPKLVFEHVRGVTQMFLDAGIQPLHENCMNYGSMSWQHALELLDKCPGLKWLFDTGNPVLNPDRSKPKPWPRQDPWEFWCNIREFTMHIHVKDAVWNAAKNVAEYRWPGEGAGCVRQIIRDALARGYTGAFSIEPHMANVYPQPATHPIDEAKMQDTFVTYGRKIASIIAEAKKMIAESSGAEH